MDVLSELLAYLVAAVPNILAALATLLIGYIIARLITTLLGRLLAAAGVDQLGERLQRIDLIANSSVDIRLSRVISKVVYYVIMLIVIVAATDVLGMEMVSNLVGAAILYLPNLIAAVVIFALGVVLADALRNIVVVTCKSVGVPAAGMVGSIVFWFVFISILITALSQARLETDFLIANLSIIIGGLALAFALAYGLAARPLMSGFLAQFYNQGKVSIGDLIELGEYSGRVTTIDRTTIVLEDKGEYVLIPLSKLQTETVRVIERHNAGDPRIERL